MSARTLTTPSRLTWHFSLVSRLRLDGHSPGGSAAARGDTGFSAERAKSGPLHVEGVSSFWGVLVGEIAQDGADFVREADGDWELLGEAR